MPSKSKTVFLDTNIFLHYKNLHELKLHEILKCDHVKAIIPMIVVNEIDDKKDSHPKPKIKKRAKNTLKKFLDWHNFPDNKLNENLSIHFDHSTNFDFEVNQLNPKKGDDCLIMAVINYRKTADKDDIVLVTGDGGPIIRSAPFAINAILLDEVYKLPEDIDPIEKENKELKQELNKLKNQLPKLSLKFNDNTSFLKHSYRIQDTDRDSLLAAKERELKNKFSSFSSNHQSIFVNESQRYDKDIQRYLSAYKRHLENIDIRKFALALSFPLKFNLHNDGSCPAEDIDIDLTFPETVTLYETDDFIPKKSKAPEEPAPPSKFGGILSHLNNYSDINGHGSILDSPVFKNNINFDTHINGSNVRIHFKSLKHHMVGSSTPFYVFLIGDQEKGDIASSFSLHYRISAANIPEPVTGDLNIVIQEEE
jgi:hypothetical protein